MAATYRSKSLLHVTLTNNNGIVPRVVPVTVFINPGEALQWFNEPGRDPTYLNDIVACLGTTEWANLQAQLERASQTEKKDKLTPREVSLGAIKFTYIAKPTSRVYTIMRADAGAQRHLPAPLAAVEIVVHVVPKHLSLGESTAQPSIVDYIARN
ncbi:hypothetical protein ACHHYP_05564 [Achlya hypogyna]|uniref:Uncharacterized protein n=1 Tax=Achlya hypogyna TaxID=1202772 RepID=A0A1V9YXD2_ACHHY|nr:hypothetical protein ACHHYP_05564 [Achlya hypogyna]